MFFRLTPILKSLLILNVAVYFLDNILLGSLLISGVPVKYWLMQLFALQPIGGFSGYISDSIGLDFSFFPWQLITYQFMHADFGHLFFNMFALWMFSTELEGNWGSAKFLVFYLLSGIGAGLAHLAISPMLGQLAPTIGASGSLYGIIIAFAMTNPDRKIMMFPLFIPIPARIFGIGMMVLSFIIGLTSQDGVAHFAHFGGALTGLFLLKFGEKTPIFKWTRRFLKIGISGDEYFDSYKRNNIFGANIFNKNYDNAENKYHSAQWTSSQQTINQPTPPPPPKKTNINNFEVGGVSITQEQIDLILDKISNSGYQSLTEQEKYILTEISKKL